MSAIDEIYNEYINMRTNGLDANETLRILRNHIEVLSKPEKGKLAHHIRRWEKEGSASQGEASNQPSGSSVRSIVPDGVSVNPKTEKPSGLRSLKNEPLESVDIADDATWMTCSNCDAKSRTDAVFCYKCGFMLNTRGAHQTKQFTDALENYDTHYFGEESLLVLKPRGAEYDIDVHPQAHEHDVVIGRITVNEAMRPDIDLAEYRAESLGVSRLHVAIRHVKNNNTLLIYDLGSANGTFINGQRLHPKEERILRDGDELRLGHLVITVHYLHPGPQIS